MDIPSAKSTGITAETKFKVMPYGRDINIIKSICEYLIFDCITLQLSEEIIACSINYSLQEKIILFAYFTPNSKLNFK